MTKAKYLATVGVLGLFCLTWAMADPGSVNSYWMFAAIGGGALTTARVVADGKAVFLTEKPMRIAILAACFVTSASATLVAAQTAPKQHPPAVQKMLSEITEDDSQIILVIKHGGAEVRLAADERTPECSRRGKQYRFALVGNGGNLLDALF